MNFILNLIKFCVTSYIWIPIVFGFYVLYNWISYKNNISESKIYAVIMIFMGISQLWLFISRYTKNILLDGMIYDFLLFISFPFTMWLVGKTEVLSLQQKVGLGITILGFLLIKFDFLDVCKVYQELK